MTLKTASEMREISDKGCNDIIQRALAIIENAARNGYYFWSLDQPEFRRAPQLCTTLTELGYVVNRDTHSIGVSWK